MTAAFYKFKGGLLKSHTPYLTPHTHASPISQESPNASSKKAGAFTLRARFHHF